MDFNNKIRHFNNSKPITNSTLVKTPHCVSQMVTELHTNIEAVNSKILMQPKFVVLKVRSSRVCIECVE